MSLRTYISASSSHLLLAVLPVLLSSSMLFRSCHLIEFQVDCSNLCLFRAVLQSSILGIYRSMYYSISCYSIALNLRVVLIISILFYFSVFDTHCSVVNPFNCRTIPTENGSLLGRNYGWGISTRVRPCHRRSTFSSVQSRSVNG